MITVLGSLNIDLTLALPRLPQPGETVLAPHATEAMGGKGANQAVAAARDGAAVRFVGAVGSDAFGARARRALAAEGIDVSGLAEVEGATGLATIWIDGHGRNMIAVASGANRSVGVEALAAVRLGPEALLVLQMEVPAATVEAGIARAKAAGSRVLLNLAPALPLPLAVLRSVDILVLNEHEAATLAAQLGLAGATRAATPESLLLALTAAIGTSIIVTLGSEGAIAVHERALWRTGALPVTAVDTTGAGDCFVGVLAAGLMRGVPLPDAMRRGAVAGSLACTRPGAQPSFPAGPEIDAALGGRSAPPLQCLQEDVP